MIFILSFAISLIFITFLLWRSYKKNRHSFLPATPVFNTERQVRQENLHNEETWFIIDPDGAVRGIKKFFITHVRPILVVSSMFVIRIVWSLYKYLREKVRPGVDRLADIERETKKSHRQHKRL